MPLLFQKANFSIYWVSYLYIMYSSIKDNDFVIILYKLGFVYYYYPASIN